MTVSNSLYPERSPCRTVLTSRVSYGCHLSAFLQENLPLDRLQAVLEVGGGYGYLMRDFLRMNPNLCATMVDISPFLLGEQKKTLQGFPVNFHLTDFFTIDKACLGKHDLVILNENLGDFPTAVALSASCLREETSPERDVFLSRIRDLFDFYSFPEPEHDPFNFNLGAVEVTETLCREAVPYIFLSEHSCQATVPDAYRDIIAVSAPGNPERITLKGHHEYTVKFTHLETVAKHYGYRIRRGPLADFIRIDFNDSLLWMLKRRHTTRHEQEILRHFVADLFQYEYLLLSRKGL